MIELEIFQREPTSRVHVLKIWHGDSLAYANELCTVNQLVELRNALHNELLWLNDYLDQKDWNQS